MEVVRFTPQLFTLGERAIVISCIYKWVSLRVDLDSVTNFRSAGYEDIWGNRDLAQLILNLALGRCK